MCVRCSPLISNYVFGELYHGYDHHLGHLAGNPRIFMHDNIFCEDFFLKRCLSTSLVQLIHIKGLYEEGFHFKKIIIFLDFLQIKVIMDGMSIHRKGSNISNLLMVP